MDCNMPFKDGYETTNEIRQLLFNTGVIQPIICAVTGHTEPMYVKTAIQSGMNSVFSKPIRGQSLAQVLKNIDMLAK
jgi:CheY-like chemotaxis protein